MQTIIFLRNTVLSWGYRYIAKPLFFRCDPERIHDHIIRIGKILGQSFFLRFITKLLFDYKRSILKQSILGIQFSNPIGLSAGFDKNAELTNILSSVGFGFMEVGSITGAYCPGNEGKRLWRLPKSKGLVVYYGLKNDGCATVAKRLASSKTSIPVGVSVAATNCLENQDINRAVEDMTYAFKTMEPFGQYITVNISCPNTQTGQPFLVPEHLELLLSSIDAVPTLKPIFIKLSPDMSFDLIDSIVSIAKQHRVHGIVCSNLTKDKTISTEESLPSVGGISGVLVKDKADALLSYLYTRYGKTFILIGSGGVFSAEDAYKKIKLGASLVQLITGMVFQGPQLISSINYDLVRLLKKDGFGSIAEAVGSAYDK